MPHAMRNKRKPRYIGLREIRYTPSITKDDALSGFIGLTVVLAFRNDVTPITEITAAIIAIKMETIMLLGIFSENCGNSQDNADINAMRPNVSANGGILILTGSPCYVCCVHTLTVKGHLIIFVLVGSPHTFNKSL